MEVAIGEKKEDRAFYLEFEEAGCDSTFWLTKTAPGGKSFPKITAGEAFPFFFPLKKEEGGLLACRVENNRQGCSKGECRSVILSCC